ncbi:hypothetical protein [Methylibium sp.]|uniref:hypothetical protein n=1 Tax=Methylibium sp. TaxID=2067992 RepID=UPI003D0C8451
MTFAHVRERLDALLQSDRPKVLMLFGDWGTGKTYQWSQALARAPSTPPYAYVSTFGLSSLSDLRRRIAEESVLAINLPEGGKVADALSSLGGKLRPAQLLKLLPVLPYVGRMDALAGELSFAAVRGKVICIDDVERAPNSLPVADVLGLANYLKEERQCRVLGCCRFNGHRSKLLELSRTVSG